MTGNMFYYLILYFYPIFLTRAKSWPSPKALWLPCAVLLHTAPGLAKTSTGYSLVTHIIYPLSGSQNYIFNCEGYNIKLYLFNNLSQIVKYILTSTKSRRTTEITLQCFLLNHKIQPLRCRHTTLSTMQIFS